MKKYFTGYELLGRFRERQGSMVIYDFIVILAIREVNFLMPFSLLLFNVFAFCGWYLLFRIVLSERNSNPWRN